MKTAGAQPTAVVLGLGQNGMATCRALGRVGIPVIGIDTDLDQPSARTRYATKFHCPVVVFQSLVVVRAPFT